MSEVPLGWKLTSVGMLAESLVDGPFGSNLKSEHYSDSGTRVIRLQNIADGFFDDRDKAFVSTEHAEGLQRHEARSGDVLIAAMGDVLPRTCLVPAGLGPAIVKADCFRLRPHTGVSSSLLSYFLSSPQMRQQASTQISGVGRPRLNLRKVSELAIPLPPTNEQERIVAAIEEQFSRLDAGRTALESAQRKLKLLTQSASASLDAKANAPGWVRTLLGDVATIDSGPAFPSSSFGGPDEGIRLLRGENIEPGNLRWIKTRTWPKEMLDGYEHLFVDTSDLIVAMDRPIVAAGLKLAPVAADDLPALLVQRVARIRPKPNVDTRFLLIALMSPRFAPHLLRSQAGTQIPHITLADIRSFPLSLPGLEVQMQVVQEIDRLLTQINSIKTCVESAAKRTEKLKVAVLHRAFSGRLLAQDPTDEPASTLLERIAPYRVSPGKSSAKIGRTTTRQRTGTRK